MSPQFDIPIMLEFRPKRLNWAVWDATIAGWAWEYRVGIDPRTMFRRVGHTIGPDSTVAIRLQSRSRKETVFATLSLHDVPPQLAKLCGSPARHVAIPDSAKRGSFPVLLARSIGEQVLKPADPDEAFRDFFAIGDDLDELQAFANKWGVWDARELPICREETIVPVRRLGIPCILPHVVRLKQAEYRRAVHGWHNAWLAKPDTRLQISQRAKWPYFFASTDNCRDVICAAITIRHLRDERPGVCARPECRKYFVMGNGRKHCSQECAHVMAQRAYRGRFKGSEIQR
jgi:hypothetical protein